VTTGPVLLVGTGLSFSHGDRRVLDDVTLALPKGQLCALVGPNGSGKTTLVRLLLGLMAPQSGTVSYPSGPMTIGYVPQRTRLDADVPATVAEIISTGLLASGRISRAVRAARVEAALKDVQMDDRSASRMGELSGGQQQRVLIARAIVRDPSLLVLDEPVSGVDSDSQRAFHDILERQVAKGAAVLLVSHELSAVDDLLDRVVVLRHRRVEFDGAPSELSARGVSLGVHAHDLPVWLERS
jgi:zinc transport system ATP-binding protein